MEWFLYDTNLPHEKVNTEKGYLNWSFLQKQNFIV